MSDQKISSVNGKSGPVSHVIGEQPWNYCWQQIWSSDSEQSQVRDPASVKHHLLQSLKHKNVTLETMACLVFITVLLLVSRTLEGKKILIPLKANKVHIHIWNYKAIFKDSSENYTQ